MEALAIFLNILYLPFAHHTNGSFVVCPFVDEETNGSLSFVND
jgi:hypothetical protein